MSQELRVDITGNSKGLQKATKQADKNLQNFNNGLKNIAGNLAAAFGTREIIAFGKQAVQTAGKVEGVRKAFEKLNGANLDDLRKATAGTVSDLELMQKANLAAKLGLDVSKLGNLFAFAAKTAQETGQSVEYLSQSIVTGIGRKSALILDNLGISAIQLKEALGGVSLEAASVAQVTEAVGKIAAQNMGDAAGVVETTEIKTARLDAAWQNLTATFGTRAAPAYDKLLDFLTDAVEGLEKLYKTTGEISMGIGGGIGQDMVSQIFGKTDDIEERRRLLQEAISDQKRLREEQGQLASTLEKNSGWLRDVADSWGVTTDQAEQASDKVGEFTGIIETLETALKSLNETTTKDGSIFSEGYQKTLDAFALKMAALTAETAELGSDTLQGRIDATKAAIIALAVEGSEPAREAIERLKASLAALQDQVRTTGDVAPLADRTKPSVITTPTGAPAMPSPDVSAMSNFDFKLDEWVKKVQAFNDISQEVGFTWENLGVQFTQVFTGMLQEGTMTFKGLLTALIKLITKMMTALIVSTALRSVMGDAGAAPRAIAAAGAIGTAIGGLAAGAIPGLANGGVVTSPTLALIGEGRESEAVLPLSKLDAMMQGGGGGYVETRIDGQDLILMIDRARRFNGRING